MRCKILKNLGLGVSAWAGFVGVIVIVQFARAGGSRLLAVISLISLVSFGIGTGLLYLGGRRQKNAESEQPDKPMRYSSKVISWLFCCLMVVVIFLGLGSFVVDMVQHLLPKRE